MKLKYILCGFVVLALLAGCAKPPIAEMESAKAAVDKAKFDKAAQLYGGISLNRAQESLRQMQVAADSKRYDAARTHAAEAIEAANRALTEGKNGLDRDKRESEGLIADLKPRIEETERNINGARYNQLKLDFAQINRDFKNAKDDAEQAEKDQANGKYKEAMDKGMSARATLVAINQQIASVIPRKKS